MPVVIKYIVERDGIEKMTFTSKADADAYDKLLDVAESLYTLLDESKLAGDHQQKEALSMFLAENKDSFLEALGSKRKPPSKPKISKSKESNLAQLELTDAAQREPLEDLVIEPDEDVIYDDEETTIRLDEEDLEDLQESDAA